MSDAQTQTAPFFNHARYCATGGLRTRDHVFLLCRTNDNRCNTVMQQVDMGGPLDAPEVMPAGSVESVLHRNWRGDPRPTTSTFSRA